MDEISSFKERRRKRILANYAAKRDERVSGHEDGGKGSGNFGHKGRPGERGGSGDGSGQYAEPKASKSSGRSVTKSSGNQGHRNHEEEMKRHGLSSLGASGLKDALEEDRDNSMKHHVDENGNITKEREALHKDIMCDEFQYDIKDASGNVIGKGDIKKADGKPTTLFMGGGSGSGKSTVLKSGKVDAFKKDEAVTVDADELKGHLPEYNKMVADNDDDAAAFAHEESSALAKRLTGLSQQNGYNTIVDGTGDGSVKGMLGKIKAARDAGNEVRGMYVTCSVEEALKRNEARAEKTGRKVPEERVIDIHKKVSNIFPQIASSMDSCELWDTNTSEPKLVASCKYGEKIKVHDSQLWDNFINKQYFGN